MRFLVTGGAGFIGSHTVEALLSQGHSVLILDNFSTGKRKNLESFEGQAELIQGDILDPGVCERAVRDVDSVIHLAAQISVTRSIEDPLETQHVNVDGTLNLLEASRKAKVQSFVFASSCAVYGDAQRLPINEEAPVQPLSPYAISKLTGEYYCTLYRRIHGLKTCVFRFFNIFGSRQDDLSPYASAIAIFTRRLLKSQPVTIYGDGNQTRDFLYVKNVASALISSARNVETFCDPVYNLATGRQTTVNQLFSLLSKLTGNSVPVSFVDARKGEIKYSAGSAQLFSSRSKSIDSTFAPSSLEESLAETVRWYASQ